MIRPVLAFIVVLLAPWNAFAIELDKADIHLNDQATLQRGARVYMNYCSGCHTLRYLRYERLADDLGLTEPLLKNNLMFTTAGVSDPIKISMPSSDARKWFGLVPPDLSLVVRARGADWVYTYLKSFYADKTRPFGSNNLVMRDTMMPNVLFPLSGQVILEPPDTLNVTERGQMTPYQFDNVLIDVVTFLAYVAEPEKTVRQQLGYKVLGFLAVFLMIAFALRRYYR